MLNSFANQEPPLAVDMDDVMAVKVQRTCHAVLCRPGSKQQNVGVHPCFWAIARLRTRETSLKPSSLQADIFEAYGDRFLPLCCSPLCYYQWYARIKLGWHTTSIVSRLEFGLLLGLTFVPLLQVRDKWLRGSGTESGWEIWGQSVTA